jgi:hypothetical protein
MLINKCKEEDDDNFRLVLLLSASQCLRYLAYNFHR